MEETLKVDKDAFSLSAQDALLLQDRQVYIDKVSMDTPARISAGKKWFHLFILACDPFLRQDHPLQIHTILFPTVNITC